MSQFSLLLFFNGKIRALWPIELVGFCQCANGVEGAGHWPWLWCERNILLLVPFTGLSQIEILLKVGMWSLPAFGIHQFLPETNGPGSFLRYVLGSRQLREGGGEWLVIYPVGTPKWYRIHIKRLSRWELENNQLILREDWAWQEPILPVFGVASVQSCLSICC